MCCSYATVVSPKQKFDPRARQCIFIGYPHSQKSYKLFDIDAGTFFTSRDVIFHESVFPFYQQSQTQSSPPLQGILPIDIDLPTPVQHSHLSTFFSYSSQHTPLTPRVIDRSSCVGLYILGGPIADCYCHPKTI